jgi:hypothetical protein
MADAGFSCLTALMRIKIPIQWLAAKVGETIVIRPQPPKPIVPLWLKSPAQRLIASIPERRTA